jgi:AcrR family transcriptional regulator
MPPDPTRKRFFEAMIAVALERDYEQAEIAAVTERAGLTRADFDRCFSDKQDCALQTFADISDRLAKHVRATRSAVAELPWRLRARAIAYEAARYFAGHGDDFRFGALVLPDVGDLALSRQYETLQNYVELIDEGRGEPGAPASLTRASAEVVVGSVFELFTKRLQETGFEGIESLVPELMYIAVAPYCGPEAAREELSIPAPAPLDLRPYLAS